MKKSLSLFVVAIAILVLATCVMAGDKSYKISTVSYKLYINKTFIPTTMINHEGRTYLKMRDMANIFGFGMEWQEKSNTISLKSPKENQIRIDKIFELPIKKGEKLVGYPSTTRLVFDELELVLDKIVFQNYTYLQLRQVAEIADATVKWDAKTNSIQIERQANIKDK